VRRIEAWGTELAMAIRRRSDAMGALAKAEAEVAELEKRILSATNDETWMGTDEYDSLPKRRNAETEQFARVQESGCTDFTCPHYGVTHMHSPDGQVYGFKIRNVPQEWAS
jgi:hypothetical protein